MLEEAATILDRSIAQPRPRYFAFIGSSGLPIGVVGDMLAACFDVNLATWAAAATRIEEQAVQWAAEFLGYPASTGAFTSGGTVSNVTALAAARERALPGARRTGLSGRRCALYASAEAHYSVKRAAELLGIGDENVRLLPIDDRRRLRPDAVAAAIDADLAAGIVPGRGRGDDRNDADRRGRSARRDRGRLRAARCLAPRRRRLRRRGRDRAVGAGPVRGARRAPTR